MALDYDHLITLDSLKGYPPEEQIDMLGFIVDQAGERNNEPDLQKCIALAEQIDVSTLTDVQHALYQYFLSNAWTCLRRTKVQTNNTAWDFNMSENSKEIFHLRKAISLPGFRRLTATHKANIYTNLANALSFLGRFVESQEYWNKALHIQPTHAMALANKFRGQFFYAQHLFDIPHKNIFFVSAYFGIKHVVENPAGLTDEAREQISAFFANFESRINKSVKHPHTDLNNFDLGANEELKKYRLWSLDHQLYINPLNDLGPYPKSSHDCLTMPAHVVPRRTVPGYITLYNQMKQEYGTARFLYYEYTQATQPHFSDKDIVLIDTGENALYSIHLEKAKIAFRMAYSVLDKIAFFLNDYLKLDIAETTINFKKIWYGTKKNQGVRPEFIQSKNLPLRALFWLSKDIFSNWEMVEVVIEPEARKIADIRNHIEHRSLKVIANGVTPNPNYDPETDLSFSISKAEFEQKVLKLLKLVRAAMIYLPLMVAIEEEKSKEAYEGKSLPIDVQQIPFDQKH